MVKSAISGDSQSENIQSITDLMKESFEQAHSKSDLVDSVSKDLVNPEAKFQASLINAERFKNPRKSSVISDSLKLQGLEHKVDGHDKGNLKNHHFIAKSIYRLNSENFGIFYPDDSTVICMLKSYVS